MTLATRNSTNVVVVEGEYWRGARLNSDIAWVKVFVQPNPDQPIMTGTRLG